MLSGYREGGIPVYGSSLVTACDMVSQKGFRKRISEKRCSRIIAVRIERMLQASVEILKGATRTRKSEVIMDH